MLVEGYAILERKNEIISALWLLLKRKSVVNCVFVGVNLLRDDPAGGRTTALGYNCLEGSDAAAGTAWSGGDYGSRSCLSSIIMQNRPDGFGM